MDGSADSVKIATYFRHAHIVQYLYNANLDQPCIEGMSAWRGPTILSHQLPMDIRQQLVSRGLLNKMRDAVEDFQLFSGPMTGNQSPQHSNVIYFIIATSYLPEVFELCFRTVFPL